MHTPTGGPMRRRMKAVAALGLALLFVAATAAPSSAVHYSGGLLTQTFCVKNPGVNSTWLSAINNGRNSWNNHPNFPGNVSAANSCPHLLTVGSYGASWLGVYTPAGGLEYGIRLDSKNLNAHINANGYTFARVVKSTTAHEFGHALRLGHPTGSNYLMSHSRNRNTITGPQNSEVAESNGYYP